MIKVEGLTKRYARTVAVDNISFEVAKGGIVGFLGPNGACKTTTMRVLTCFLPPSSGSASVAGFDVLEHPLEVKKRIGYLPESPPLYPEMEVDEYLTFVGRLKGIYGSDIARRVSEVSGRCAVSDVRTKVIIISHGKLVATDSVANLTNRLRGAEAVAVDVDAPGGLKEEEARGRLEQVAGVSRVMHKESRDGRHIFEVESLQGRSVRADLARAVVAAGWNLNELRTVGLSLETIFLQLTASESKGAAKTAAPSTEP